MTCGLQENRQWMIGKPAVNPRKITSEKIIDEVVCQCELAERSVPPAIIKMMTMDSLLAEAEQSVVHVLHN